MAAWQDWEVAVLNQLGVKPTSAAVQFLDEWAGREGGSAAFNPLNTTLYLPGASSYNSVGVRNFTSAAQGAQATASTLRGYPAIVAAIASGNPAAHAGDSQVQGEFLKWSGGGYTWPTSSGHVSMTSGGGSSVGSPPSSTPGFTPAAAGAQSDVVAQMLLSNGGLFPQARTIRAGFKNPVVKLNTQPPADLTHALTVAKRYLDQAKGSFSNAGFAQYVHQLRGTSIPGSGRAQYRVTRPSGQPRPGDLVFSRGGQHLGVMVDHQTYLGASHGGKQLNVSALAQGPTGALTIVRTVDGAGPVA